MEAEEKRLFYKSLTDKLPEAAIQRTKSTETHKGYDTTGYGYQYIVDRLNEVCGLDGWGFAYTVLKEVEGKYRDKSDGTPGSPYYDVTVDITMWIKFGESGRAERSHVGGHIASMYGDALKGAITSGLKKTAALFGIGADAYRGEMDDDNKPLPGNHSDRGSATSNPGKNDVWVKSNYKPNKKQSDAYKAQGVGKWTKQGEAFIWWWKKGEEHRDVEIGAPAKQAGDFEAAKTAINNAKNVDTLNVLTSQIDERRWVGDQHDVLLKMIDDKIADYIAGEFGGEVITDEPTFPS